MAKVATKVIGGQLKEMQADTVGELAALLGVTKHQASVNGEPQNNDYELSDDEYVTFAEKVKGA